VEVWNSIILHNLHEDYKKGVWGIMDILVLEKMLKSGMSLYDALVSEVDNWEEVEREKDRFVKESLENDPELAKIYAALVRKDITFAEFVAKKHELERVKALKAAQ
jgi:3-methyladenine DNA glycosylase AlkD